MVNQQAIRTTLPRATATNLSNYRLRDISFGAHMTFRPRLLLHSRCFEVEFFFVTPRGKSLEPFRRIA